ncbi:hypothetical protein DFH27DRAFT_550962 [Peziza echinospora]|nr:hypothetical protein DFH27DRAFT_550962 [Peziza echinospora]
MHACVLGDTRVLALSALRPRLLLSLLAHASQQGGVVWCRGEHAIEKLCPQFPVLHAGIVGGSCKSTLHSSSLQVLLAGYESLR